MQKLKSNLSRTLSLKVLRFKPGVGQYIAVHTMLTARDFFLAYFYSSCPFNCIFSQNLSQVSTALAVADTSSCVGPQNKTGHPAECRFPCYCNFLLFGCPQYLLNRLQKVKNNAARLIWKAPKTDHITPHLRTLYWLPIDARIKYKLCCLCFGATGPIYLSDLLKIYTPSRQL